MTRTDQFFGVKTKILYAWCLNVAIGLFFMPPVLACPGPTYEQTIIFDYVPTDVDAPVIVEVTIINMTPDLTGSMAVMNARVENVIKGQIGEGMLRIVSPLGDCSKGSGVGSHGFVAGELRSDANGIFELAAVSVSIRKAIARPR